MKAIQLTGLTGTTDLRLVDIESPRDLIAQDKLKMFAVNSFPLSDVKSAFAAISSRQTTGKVVLVP